MSLRLTAMKGGGGIQSEINITPLVDVVLVLLIIFMVAQPMLNRGYRGAIPAPATTDDPPPAGSFLLRLEADPASGALAALRLNRDGLPRAELAGRVGAEMQRLAPRDRVVFIDCDDRVKYSDLMDVVDELKQAGVMTVGFATSPVASDA
jgi:biopolymer transport protein ExbD